MKIKLLFGLGVVSIALFTPSGVSAGSSPGGLSLSVHEMNRLDGWMAQNIYLDNLYSQGTELSSASSSDAADDKSPTFVDMNVSLIPANTDKNSVMGGYIPQAWNNNGHYNHTTALNMAQDGFVFTLATGNVFFQAPVPIADTANSQEVSVVKASPVPAPETVLLLSSGLACLFGLRNSRSNE